MNGVRSSSGEKGCISLSSVGSKVMERDGLTGRVSDWRGGEDGGSDVGVLFLSGPFVAEGVDADFAGGLVEMSPGSSTGPESVFGSALSSARSRIEPFPYAAKLVGGHDDTLSVRWPELPCISATGNVDLVMAEYRGGKFGFESVTTRPKCQRQQL